MDAASIFSALGKISLSSQSLSENSVSASYALRIAADSIVEADQCNVGLCSSFVVKFGSVIVEIMKAMEERMLRERTSCLEGDTMNAEDESLLVDANSYLFFSVAMRVMPHLKLNVEEIIVAVKGKRGAHAASSLIESALNTSKAEYLVALRSLLEAGCMGAFDEAGVDFGRLFELARDLDRADGGESIDVANEQEVAQLAGSKARVGYQALCILGLVLHMPPSSLLAKANDLLSSTNLGVLISMDALDGATIAEARRALTHEGSSSSSSSSSVSIVQDSYSLQALRVAGYAMPTHRTKEQGTWVPKMVSNKTSMDNFVRLMVAVQMALPVLVQGGMGSGKSFMIRELAAAMGKDGTLVELQMDDQTDSKTLIGTYVCSDVPGEFVWQSGVVAQAATKGHWLVIEDIDKVNLEVIAALSPLLERRKLYLPNRGVEITVHPSFRLFGTLSVAGSNFVHVGGNNKFTGSDALPLLVAPTLRHFSHLFLFVDIKVPSQREVEEILDSKFPGLAAVAKNLILKTYRLFSAGGLHAEEENNEEKESSDGEMVVAVDEKSGSKSNFSPLSLLAARQFTLRDLMKVAKRIERYSSDFNKGSTTFLTEAQKRMLLCEIVDVFAASARRADQYASIVHKLGEVWGVSPGDIDTAVLEASPSCDVTDVAVTVGRGRVVCSEKAAMDRASGKQQFALTKHARRLLEKVSVCVSMGEPVLLVGETGSGKTTSVQELADMTARKLVVQNLSLSTDSSDLLGGFRPVTMVQLFQPSYVRFVTLFQDTFAASQNAEYLQIVSQLFKKQQWKRLLRAFMKAAEKARGKIDSDGASAATAASSESDSSPLRVRWQEFELQVRRFEANLPRIEFGFAFAFVDGLLVEAMRQGHWVLLDEINLASPETLQGLAGVLEGQSLCLTEKGDLATVERHPDFHIFAAMNPPTDVGKKELPAALRSRFTELYAAEMTDPADLRDVVSRYLHGIQDAPIDDIVSVYLGCRASSEMTLVDSGGQRPRYSLRSLTRSLQAGKRFMGLNLRPLNRALFEGILLNFQTLLGEASRRFMLSFLQQSLGITMGKEYRAPPSRPGGKTLKADKWELVGPFWLRTGTKDKNDWAEKDEETGITRYVMTKTVEASIRDLSAAVAANVAPVLLQGPTSVGKTTMIEYLAARTGYKCVRINNHEHTDVQEYIGGYVTNALGQLEFQDGLLVEALRKGYWLILDELNLAPSEVLEALNRLLDDNKELYIPETGETVRPAEGFTLFATQNPPGAYGGRKPLSRAFRNRFLELSVCDLPSKEVEEIITLSCGIPPRYSQMLVATMTELQVRRQKSNLFGGKYGSVTTRDLLKWGRRKPASGLEVAEEGYMLLAEKLRSFEERSVIQEILEKACGVKMDASKLYDESLLDAETAISSSLEVLGEERTARQGRDDLLALKRVQEQLRTGELEVEGVRGVAITAALRRMWRLVGRCISQNEPVLLIGETGSGKTTICQLFAATRGQKIRILNCHQSTETTDIIGGLRPVRNRESTIAQARENLLSLVQAVCASDCAPLTCTVPTLAGGEECSWKDTLLALNATVLAATEPLEVTAKSLLAVVEAFVTSFEEKEVKREAAAALAAQPVSANKKKGKGKGKKAKHDIEDSPASASMMTEGDDAAAAHEWTEPSEEEKARVKGLREHLGVTIAAVARSRALFEWQDGPLVTAMKEGDIFVLDEINLAEDAVVERLNSVLESGREITLAEKGGIISERIIAHPNFKFLATMNPGGDFGKRELSPALRSRFTEIWAPSATSDSDLNRIIVEILHLSQECQRTMDPSQLARHMVAFMKWMVEKTSEVAPSSSLMSTREVLAWSRFVSISGPVNELQAYQAMVHGAHMVMLDGLGLGSTVSRDAIYALKSRAVEDLLGRCPPAAADAVRGALTVDNESVAVRNGQFTLGPFATPLGNHPIRNSGSYSLTAQSTLVNVHRILRAMQLPRPILLEGPPGVGKSSIIAHLAAITGHKLVRINLSEHSEISDLLGTDLPAGSAVESEGDEEQKGGDQSSSSSSAPRFVWCDGVFLTAMKAGDWVLLDELNLAPQSVLEGLNACFDHREEVFLPEIGKSVHAPPSFRVFCAQNPMVEGGGRKGLPQSFLTRFSRVFVESMSADDMRDIALSSFASTTSITSSSITEDISEDVGVMSLSEEEKGHGDDDNVVDMASPAPQVADHIPSMVSFIRRLQTDIVDDKAYGRIGAPWEFNLRDVFRWCELVQHQWHLVASLPDLMAPACPLSTTQYVIADAAYTLFVARLRSPSDRLAVCEAFQGVFGFPLAVDLNPTVHFENSGIGSTNSVYIGSAGLPVSNVYHLQDDTSLATTAVTSPLIGGLSKSAQILSHAIGLKWPVLLIGASGSGKRRMIRQLACLTSNRLVEYTATSSTDSTELLGSFEQASVSRVLFEQVQGLEQATMLVTGASMEVSAADAKKSKSFFDSISAGLTLLSSIKARAIEVAEGNMIDLPAGDALRSSMKKLLTKLEKCLGSSVFQVAYKDTAVSARASIDHVKRLLSSSSTLATAAVESTAGNNSSGKRKQGASADTGDSSASVSASSSSSSGSSGGFEWVDGVVVKAVERGHWLLIDNVNQCSASVLDRLNSLLEPNGTLLLTEGGGGRVVTPHPDFRIFFAMDPQYGEISRAMRNRCVEVAVLSEGSSEAMIQTIRECYGPGVSTGGARLVNLAQALSSSSSSGGSDNESLVRLPEGTPRTQYMSRLLRMLSIEQAAGRRTFSDALERAVETVIPPALPVVKSRGEIAAAAAATAFETPAALCKAVAFLHSTRNSLDRPVQACLLLIVAALSTKAHSREDTKAVYNLLSSVGQELGPEIATILQSVKERGDSVAGAMFEGVFGTATAAAIDKAACISADDLLRCALAELTKRLGESPEYMSAFVQHALTAVFDLNEQEEELGYYLQSLPQPYVEMFGAFADAKALPSAHHTVEGTLTAASLTASAGEPSQVSFARVVRDFADRVFFRRMADTLGAEANTRRVVDGMTNVGPNTTFGSVWALAYAMSTEALVTDSREHRILHTIFNIVKGCDALLGKLVEIGVRLDGSSSRRAHLKTLLSSVTALTEKRDAISLSLRVPQQQDRTRKLSLPWENVIISVKWARDAFEAVKAALEALANDGEETFSPLGSHIEWLQWALQAANEEVEKYWGGALFTKQSLLWKVGGHAAVPSDVGGWAVLSALRSMVSIMYGEAATSGDVSMTNIPSYIDSSVQWGLTDVKAGVAKATDMDTVREWLALYSTFYWASTTEGADSKGRKSINVAALTEQLRLKITDRVQSKRKARLAAIEAAAVAAHSTPSAYAEDKLMEVENDPSQKMMMETADELKFDMRRYAAVEEEWEAAGEGAVTLLAEPVVMRALMDARSVLSTILLQPTYMSSQLLQTLTKALQSAIRTTIQHTRFDPRLLRELQSLLWAAEAHPASGASEYEESFLSVARNCLYSLDTRIFYVFARNLSNLALAIDHSYVSPSLPLLLKPGLEELYEEGNVDPLEVLLSQDRAIYLPDSVTRSAGALLQTQPLVLRAALMQVDLEVLESAPRTGALTTYNVAAHTVSNSQLVKKRLLQMIRLIGADEGGSSDGLVSQLRLPALARLVFDVTAGCQTFMPADSDLSLLPAPGAEEGDWVALVTFNADRILRMKLGTQPLPLNIQAVMRESVVPALELLATADVHAHPERHIMAICRVWALMGCAQMKLVLPNLPVDPATYPGVEASLLANDMRRAGRAVALSSVVSALSGQEVVSPGAAVIAESVLELQEDVTALSKQAIERPPLALPFPSVYSDLRAACCRFGDSEKISELFDNLAQFHKSRKVQTLDVCAQQEAAWQSNASSFYDSVTTPAMSAYEDVILPVLSALHNTSSALRLAVGRVSDQHACANDAETCGAGGGKSNLSVERAWGSLTRYPLGGAMDAESLLTSGSERLTAKCLLSLENLLRGKDLLAARAQRILEETKAAQSQSSKVRKQLPNADSLPHAATANALLLALMRLDCLVGGGTVELGASYSIFNNVLDGFVESHLKAEDRRLAAEEAKKALYKNKMQEDTYESNEAKEEEEALRVHFPDHLQTFRDILASEKDADGKSLFGDDTATDKDDGGDVAVESMDMEFNQQVTSKLVGTHARMLFIHSLEALSKGGRVFSKGSDSSVATPVLPLSLRAQLLMPTATQGLVVAKTLDWSLQSLVAPGMDQAAKPSALAALTAMVDKEGLLSFSEAHTRSWNPALTRAMRSAAAEQHRSGKKSKGPAASAKKLNGGVDKDLMLMLFHEHGADNQWRPRNFHLDANPEEAAKAEVPLKNLLRRCLHLLSAFPGNEILLTVARLAAHIADMHVSTPIGKLLISLQLLSKKAQDWEQYAARHVSVSPEMASLAALIAEWRELELRSWDELLRCKEVEYADRALAHWYSLARIIRSTPSELQELGADSIEHAELSRTEAAKSRRRKNAAFGIWNAFLNKAPAWMIADASGASDKSKSEKAKQDALDAVAAAIALKEKEALGASSNQQEVETVWGAAARRIDAKESEKEQRGPLNSATYLRTVFDILDGFLRKSVTGEFPMRLHLVRLFALQLEVESVEMQSALDEQREKPADASAAASAKAKKVKGKSKSKAAKVEPVSAAASLEHDVYSLKLHLHRKKAHIALGVWQYYSQFLEPIRSFQDSTREPVLKRLKGEVKLGKWDQMNTYALIEHSEKVHRKLNRLIREYQSTVLDQLAWSVLRKVMIGDLASEHGELQTTIVVPSDKAIFPRLDSRADSNNDEDASAGVVTLLARGGPAADTATEALPASILSHVATTAHPQVLRLHTLRAKMAKYAKALLRVPAPSGSDGDNTALFDYSGSVRFGHQATEAAQDLCSDVFSRIASLREEGVTRPVKHRALVDMFRELRRQQIPHLRSHLPSELKDTVFLLSVPTPLPCETAGDLESSSRSSGEHSLFERAELYYARNIAELIQLRTQASAPFSRDVSLRESQLMSGFADNLFYLTMQQRVALGAALADYQSLQQGLTVLRTRVSGLSTADSDATAASGAKMLSTKHALQVASVLLDELVQLRRLVAGAREAHSLIDAEEDQACPPVGHTAATAAYAAVDSAVHGVQSAAELLSTLTIRAHKSASPAEALGQFVLRSVEGAVDDEVACLHPSIKAAYAAVVAAASSLHACESFLVPMVSPQAWQPVIETIEGYATLLSCDSDGGDNNAAASDEAEEEEEEGAVSDQTAALVSACIELSLTGVQRLRSMGQLNSNNNQASDDKKTSPYNSSVEVVQALLGGDLGRQVAVPDYFPFPESDAKDEEEEGKQKKRGEGKEGEEEEEEEEQTPLAQAMVLSMAAASVLHTDSLGAAITSLSEHLRSAATSGESKAAKKKLLEALLPLLALVEQTHQALLHDLCLSMASSGKLLYVCLRVFRVLLAKGFCAGETEDGEGEGEGGGDATDFSQEMDGTGMGEGQGAKDVSDQIDNEEQLLGLKDEDKDEDNEGQEGADKKEKLDKEEEEQGVEMSADFDGDMHDLPDEEDEEKKNKNEEEEEEDNEEELDREMGDANMEDIVDEKQWDSDEDDDDDKGDGEGEEKFEQDSKMKGEELEGETHTKDEDEKEKEKEKEKGEEPKEEKKEEKKEEAGDEGEEEGEDQVNEDKEENKQEKPQGVDVRQEEDEDDNDENPGDPGQEEEEEKKEEEGEDLPDDMNIEDGAQQDNEDDDGEGGEEEEGETVEMAGEEDDKEDEEQEKGDNEEEEEMKEEDDKGDDIQMSGGVGNEEDKPPNEDEEEEEEEKEEDEEEDIADAASAPKPKEQPAAFGVKTGEQQAQSEAVLGTEEDEGEGEQEKEEDQGADTTTDTGPKGQGGKKEGAGDTGDAMDVAGDEEGAPPQGAEKRRNEAPNPFQQRGDLDKKWHRRLKIESPDEKEEDGDGDQDDEEEGDGDMNDDPNAKKREYEHIHDKSRKEQDQQVLAEAADEEDAPPMPGAQDDDEDQQKQDQAEGEREDENAKEEKDVAKDDKLDEEEGTEERKKRERRPEADRESSRKRPRTEEDGNDDKAGDKDSKEEGEGMEVEEEEKEEEQEQQSGPGADGDSDGNEEDDRVPQIKTNEQFRMGRQEDEALAMQEEQQEVGDEEEDDEVLALRDADDEDDDELTMTMAEARDKWTNYRSHTDTHSIRLCEQLRLILEPTLATRLQGDYRTGKRINMRRVIQYVASGFRKDKIWLRRTKPAKRDYQVMVMIDDSKSMGEAGPLALHSLATISNALTKLEVGDLSVVSFADSVRVLHPFGRPFTDEAGAEVVSKFAFEADNTLLGASLQAVTPLLEAASKGAQAQPSSAGAVCLQICFVISDARLDSDNRERLDKVVKDMAEKHILVVLVVLDKHDDPRNSIFNTKSVEFRGDKIITSSYLDNFPFPYYIAIQDLEALPDVLSDALRQWFELIGNQIDNN